MLRFFNKRLHNRKGFTLIELIVVIAILGILALIAIPRFTGMTQRAEVQARTSMATTILNAAEVAFVEIPNAPTPITDLASITIPNLQTAGYLRQFTNTNPTYTLTPVGTAGQFRVTVPNPQGGTITVGTPTT